MAYRTVNPILPPLAARATTCLPALAAAGDIGHARALRVPSGALRPPHTPQMIGVGAGLAAIALTRPFDRPLRLFVSQNTIPAAPNAGRKLEKL